MLKRFPEKPNASVPASLGDLVKMQIVGYVIWVPGPGGMLLVARSLHSAVDTHRGLSATFPHTHTNTDTHTHVHVCKALLPGVGFYVPCLLPRGLSCGH